MDALAIAQAFDTHRHSLKVPKRNYRKVQLAERDAISRYLLWREHRRTEGDSVLLTFCEWLEQSLVEILPAEWPSGDSGPCPFQPNSLPG